MAAFVDERISMIQYSGTANKRKRIAVITISVLIAVSAMIAGISCQRKSEGPVVDPSADGNGFRKSNFMYGPALGNLVIGAKELGFSGSGFPDDEWIVKWIESQLFSLRQLYQREVETKPELMGSILLRLSIASGRVEQVEELKSRINDREFKKAVIAEAYKWKFPEVDSGRVNVNYPLLFVPKGFDVPTLIRWEQSLGSESRRPDPKRTDAPTPRAAEPAVEPKPRAAASRGAVQSEIPVTAASGTQSKPKAGRLGLGTYEIRSPTSIRKEPRFAATPMAQLEAGSKVTVLAIKGDWLEIQTKPGASSAFIRKEYALAAANQEKSRR